MGENSTIEWTDATWNPVTGCTKISPGCKFCYAERLMDRFGRQNFSDIVFHPERLSLPRRWRRPKRIFVNSMSDLFHENVPVAFIDRVFGVMTETSHHIFQILTKRPDRLVQWWYGEACRREIPANVWLGVSVESEQYLWRLDRLREVDASVRFLSAEPLLGPLDDLRLEGIKWVITGGESGGPPERALVEKGRDTWRPKSAAVGWVQRIRDLCVAHGVAFFHKQWGGPTPKSGGRLLDGREWSEYPDMRRDSDNGHTPASGRARQS